MAYCDSKPVPAIHYAGRFAAKEALKKALLSGKIVSNISLKNIEILNEDSGAPVVIIHQSTKTVNIQLSISHSEDQAIAMAMIQRIP